MINGLPGNPVTAADGTYAATVDYGFDGTATPTLAGYTFVPATRIYTDVAANMTTQDYAATLNTFTISGTVTPAMAGVVINGLPGNPVTAADGTYAATIDYGFDGTATPTLAGYTFFPASTTYSDVTSNQTAQNYAATILTYTISGTVTPAMAGVVINGLPGNPVTAADGTYAATVNYGFDGTATPTLAGYTFVPATRVYTDVAANMTAQDYAATLNTFTISGTVTPAMAGVVINGLPGTRLRPPTGPMRHGQLRFRRDGNADARRIYVLPGFAAYSDVDVQPDGPGLCRDASMTFTISGTVTPAMAGVVINGLPGNPVTAADGGDEMTSRGRAMLAALADDDWERLKHFLRDLRVMNRQGRLESRRCDRRQGHIPVPADAAAGERGRGPVDGRSAAAAGFELGEFSKFAAALFPAHGRGAAEKRQMRACERDLRDRQAS